MEENSLKSFNDQHYKAKFLFQTVFNKPKINDAFKYFSHLECFEKRSK